MKWDHGEKKKTIGAKVSVYVVNRSASKSVSQGILPLPPPPPPHAELAIFARPPPPRYMSNFQRKLLNWQVQNIWHDIRAWMEIYS